MNKGEIDLKLALFVRLVRAGKTPSRALLEFVADGVEAFRKNSKPWQVKTGNKPLGSKWEDQKMMLQAYAMSEIGANNARIAFVLSRDVSERAIRKYKVGGKVTANGISNSGEYMLSFAIDELLERADIKAAEKKQLRTLKAGLFAYEEDDRLLDENGNLK